MRKNISFSWLIIPLSILIFLAFALFVERSSISYTVSKKPSEFLKPLSSSSNNNETDNKKETEYGSLVLYDSSRKLEQGSFKTVTAVFDSMKIPYSIMDINQSVDFPLDLYDTLIISFIRLDYIDSQVEKILQWVNNGGKLLFAIRPDNSETLEKIYPQLGISDLKKGFIETDGVEFLTELLPGTAGKQFGLGFMTHSSLPVQLKAKVNLHLVSADETKAPILWETELGSGQIVFINSDQFIDKSSRGLIGAAYSLLHDVVIFPVINTSAFFIDDFPAPIPEGKNEAIFRQFNRDTESFFLNVWWPDMQVIKQKYHLVFTGVIIETYEYRLKPPFAYTSSQSEIFQYFGGIVLRDGGEIGLHGYNHVPLCKEEDGANQVFGYPAWETTSDMQESVKELRRYGLSMFPKNSFTTYVPVSNILCSEARKWLPEVLPELKTISSVYLPDAKAPAYVQEFEEAEDGIIEFPRIVSGYDPDNFTQWAAANERWLHYTATHFVHPDDVLDSYRSGGKSWTELRETLDNYLLWVYSSMPGIRNMTASEGAMAVQRFVRLDPDYTCDSLGCQVTLNGFYDEGWFLMRTEKTPSSITNGNITEVVKDLYLIEATADNIQIGFEE
ncbi:MAG: DUF2194 domain-containing protein [Anaerolineaceae bacterium]|nr:DUF2194 domain-containing protein [Anaerolineaceae bacterium]